MSQKASVCPKRSISISSAAGFVCQREQIFLIRSSKAHHSVFKKKLAYREDGRKGEKQLASDREGIEVLQRGTAQDK